MERLSGVDRKTVRRYITAAVELGLNHVHGEEQLNDVFMAMKFDPIAVTAREAWPSLEPDLSIPETPKLLFLILPVKFP